MARSPPIASRRTAARAGRRCRPAGERVGGQPPAPRSGSPAARARSGSGCRRGRPCRSDLRRTRAAQPLDRAVLRAGGDAQALGAVQRRHLDGRAEQQHLQTILRKEGYANPYEALKELTRKNEKITQQSISEFIDGLEVSDEVKTRLKSITPFTYVGG